MALINNISIEFIQDCCDSFAFERYNAQTAQLLYNKLSAYARDISTSEAQHTERMHIIVQYAETYLDWRFSEQLELLCTRGQDVISEAIALDDQLVKGWEVEFSGSPGAEAIGNFVVSFFSSQYSHNPAFTDQPTITVELVDDIESKVILFLLDQKRSTQKHLSCSLYRLDRNGKRVRCELFTGLTLLTHDTPGCTQECASKPIHFATFAWTEYSIERL